MKIHFQTAAALFALGLASCVAPLPAVQCVSDSDCRSGRICDGERGI